MKNYPQNWFIILNKILIDHIGQSVEVDCVLVVLVKSLSQYSSSKIPQETPRAKIPQLYYSLLLQLKKPRICVLFCLKVIVVFDKLLCNLSWIRWGMQHSSFRNWAELSPYKTHLIFYFPLFLWHTSKFHMSSQVYPIAPFKMFYCDFGLHVSPLWFLSTFCLFLSISAWQRQMPCGDSSDGHQSLIPTSSFP